MNRSPVVITGQGAVCALGLGLDAIWAELAAGRDGMKPIERFSTATFSTHLGGMVPVPGTLEVDDAKGTRETCIRYSVLAAKEAVARAKVTFANPRRVALVLGTSMGSHLGGLHEGSAEVAAALGIEGPVVTVSTACSSSTNALGIGRDLLDDGLADVVLAGGADVLCPEIFAGFHALGLLSPKKCSPFSEGIGTTLGEGAGFLVLEREADALARGAPFVACFSGYALSGDGYHATSPEPSGAGVARALRATLDDAGLRAEDIDYVNAHGTGTAANDPAEWLAISSVLGSRADQVPVSSTKSYLAHAQGAAGVLELVCSLLALGDAKLTLSGAARERTGLFVGTTNASPVSWEEFRSTIRERGLVKVSAPAFTRLVLNSATGTAARLLGLRGPTTTLTTGVGSGLVAAALAATYLSSRTDADRLVVGAVDEVDLDRDTGRSDAAAALVLTALPTEGSVRLAGWALAGPRALEEAIASACGAASVTPARAHLDALASGSLASCGAAFQSLRLGAGRTLLVDVSIAASCAVVLERSDA